jgi:hypothetical protein
MSEVLSMLENKTIQLPLPMQTVYFPRRDAERGRVCNNRLQSLNVFGCHIGCVGRISRGFGC